jgi:hypothetical protein
MKREVCLTVLACALMACLHAQDAVPKPGIRKLEPWQTLSYPRSETLQGVEFDEKARRTEAPGSDIWPITWADDGHQYAAFGDGGGFGAKGNQGRVSMGVARIEGGPADYAGKNVWGGKDAENPAQFEGKGTGIVCVNGVLYMWVAGPGSLTVPRTRLAVSRDHAQTWTLVEWEWTMEHRLFAGAFVNVGKNHEAAPDAYVYACFTRVEPVPDKPRNWIHERPGRVDLARVPKEHILEREAWEWFAGVNEAKQAQWTKDLEQRRHMFEDPNGIKIVSLCYQPALQRYLLMYNPRDPGGHFALFEAPQPWGQWSEVAYLKAVPLFMPPQETWRVSVYHFAPAWWSEDGREFTLVFNTGDDAWNTVRGSVRGRK